MTPEQLAARWLADVDRIYPWAKHQPMMLEEDALAAIARRLAPGDDLVERAEKVREQLQKDVFYGDERLHNMGRHNPLHLEASVLLCNLLSRIAALTATVAVAEKLAADAFVQMTQQQAEAARLRDRLARMEEESEGWKKAFAAQSNKLQKVLHIPGVRAALTESPTDGT